ncbi:MAG TPA: tetratricopeptide repeat protein [Acidobacteriota bacterium]|nr:tetratricopeptide repeat protein [Acidobacteriota bacterium]
MKFVRYLMLAGVLTLVWGWSVAQQQGTQEQGQTQEEQPAQQEETAEPAPPPPRVVGQVRSQAEMEAWNAVVNAPSPEQPAKARIFLEQFPDSGMTPHAHYVIAMSAFTNNNFADFMMHGEQALEELPQALDLASHLAFFYAETKKFDKAQTMAGKVTSVMADEQVRNSFQPQQRDKLLCSAHFAIGRSQLGEFMQNKEDQTKLDKAIENLEMAADLDPTDAYAYYRLGSAYRQKNDADQAIHYFTLAAATGTAVGNAATRTLGEIYDLLEKDKSKIEARIQDAQESLREKLGEKQQQWAQEAAARTTPPAETPPPGEPASPPPGGSSSPPPGEGG